VTKKFYISNSQYVSISLTAPVRNAIEFTIKYLPNRQFTTDPLGKRYMQARKVHQNRSSKKNTFSKFGMSSRWTLEFGFMLWQKWCRSELKIIRITTPFPCWIICRPTNNKLPPNSASFKSSVYAIKRHNNSSHTHIHNIIIANNTAYCQKVQVTNTQVSENIIIIVSGLMTCSSPISSLMTCSSPISSLMTYSSPISSLMTCSSPISSLKTCSSPISSLMTCLQSH